MACSLSLAEAHASECGSIKIGELELDYKPQPMLAFAWYLNFDLVSGAYLTANVAQLAIGVKPARHWRVGGWIFGTLNSLAGIGFLMASQSNDWERYLLGFGIGHLAWGLLTLGTTVAVTMMPDPVEDGPVTPGGLQVSAQPIILSGAQGEPVGGIGLSVAGW